MNNKKGFLIIILPVLLLAWVWRSRVPPTAISTNEIEAPKDQFIAPNFTAETIEGSEITLKELRGKPIILNFWASWCPPCRAEMPAFQQAWTEFGDSDLLILAVHTTYQDSLQDAESFVQEYKLEFPILLDVTGRASASYQIHSLPTTFLIDRQGIIQKTLIGGPIPLSLLRTYAEDLLKEIPDVPDY